jgi:hypothetical protein
MKGQMMGKDKLPPHNLDEMRAATREGERDAT